MEAENPECSKTLRLKSLNVFQDRKAGQGEQSQSGRGGGEQDAAERQLLWEGGWASSWELWAFIGYQLYAFPKKEHLNSDFIHSHFRMFKWKY